MNAAALQGWEPGPPVRRGAPAACTVEQVVAARAVANSRVSVRVRSAAKGLSVDEVMKGVTAVRPGVLRGVRENGSDVVFEAALVDVVR